MFCFENKVQPCWIRCNMLSSGNVQYMDSRMLCATRFLLQNLDWEEHLCEWAYDTHLFTHTRAVLRIRNFLRHKSCIFISTMDLHHPLLWSPLKIVHAAMRPIEIESFTSQIFGFWGILLWICYLMWFNIQGWLDIMYMCSYVQCVRLSVLLISLLMRFVIYGSQHKRLVVCLSATTKHHLSHLQSK